LKTQPGSHVFAVLGGVSWVHQVNLLLTIASFSGVELTATDEGSSDIGTVRLANVWASYPWRIGSTYLLKSVAVTNNVTPHMLWESGHVELVTTEGF